jgi:hypothetical protein
VPNTGVYMLMVGTGITYNEHCTVYCGWHDVFPYSTGGKQFQVPFGVVGNVARCYPICSIYNGAADKSAPNHPEIDGTASIFAHEVVEAVSNPSTGGWYDNNGLENADKCAWKFGTGVKKGARKDGSSFNYNILVNNQPFMVSGAAHCHGALAAARQALPDAWPAMASVVSFAGLWASQQAVP